MQDLTLPFDPEGELVRRTNGTASRNVKIQDLTL